METASAGIRKVVVIILSGINGNKGVEVLFIERN